MLIISFDAVGDKELDSLAQYPAVSSFMKKSTVYRNVSSLFISNTYPIHTSVATGVNPNQHGIRSNTLPFPLDNPIWNTSEDLIKSKTIWQAAAQNGIKTAAVFWPVTAYSKSINYNIPEVMARPGKSQLLTSLKAGSFWLQLKLFLRHRKLLDGTNQPNLDNFATACMADILRKHKPGLALVHLTAYDSICHKNGKNSEALKKAYESLDKNLAILLDAYSAAGIADGDVIIFSDHNQIDVHTGIEHNRILAEIFPANKKFENASCYFECGGGSAFFIAGNLNKSEVDEVRNKVSKTDWFRRFLTEEEMHISGFKNKNTAGQTPPPLPEAAFGFCAKEGYYFDTHPSSYKANHGYPLDTDDYKVFYMVKGKGSFSGYEPGKIIDGSAPPARSLLDIAPLAAKSLGIEFKISN